MLCSAACCDESDMECVSADKRVWDTKGAHKHATESLMCEHAITIDFGASFGSTADIAVLRNEPSLGSLRSLRSITGIVSRWMLFIVTLSKSAICCTSGC